MHGGQELRPSAGPHPKTEEDAGAATSWGRGHMTDTPLLPAPFSGQTTRAPNPDTGGPEAQGGAVARQGDTPAILPLLSAFLSWKSSLFWLLVQSQAFGFSQAQISC